MLAGTATAQLALPKPEFGGSCQEVREHVLAQELVWPLEGSRCGSPMERIELGDNVSGFKATYQDGSDFYILYFYFVGDRLAAHQVGTVIAMESLNAFARTSYAPFDDCYEILEPDVRADACIREYGDVLVHWVGSDFHTSLIAYDLRLLPSEDSSASPGSSQAGTTVEGFEIISYITRWEGETLWIVGELRNVGNVAAGVELQVIARDVTAQLVDVATFWPASIQNIRPGMSYGFRHPVTRERSATSVELRILGTRSW